MSRRALIEGENGVYGSSILPGLGVNLKRAECTHE